MKRLPKVDLNMGQDGETYILTIDFAEDVAISVDLTQEDIDHLKRWLDVIERVWKKGEWENEV